MHLPPTQIGLKIQKQSHFDCVILVSITRGQEIHTTVFNKGLEREPLIGNSLLDMYAKCGSLIATQYVFNMLLDRNVVSWTALIGGYVENGCCPKALDCFEKMHYDGILANVVTFICILKACSNIKAESRGQEIHIVIVKRGFAGDNVVANGLVNMYSKCGMFLEAQNVFDKLYGSGTVSWNVLISGYAQLGRNDEVFNLLNKFLSQHDEPNPMTFTILLNICSHTGLLQESKRCLETMVACYGVIPTLEHYGCIVDLLGRAGRLDEANAVISQMPFIINLSVWNSLFGACQKQGCTKLGRLIFSHIVELDEDHAAAYVGLGNIYATDLGRDV